MPVLSFYVTTTKLPTAKVREVLGGYTMEKLCKDHNGATALNPHLNHVQELIIDSKDYPCAMLRPWGYTATDENALGQFPKRTIFFYKHFVDTFEHMRIQFDAAKEGQRWKWHCGCIIRKYTMVELDDICKDRWYPWIGEREPAVYREGYIYTERQKTGTTEEIASVLKEAGILDQDGYDRAVACLKFHRGKK